MVGTMEQIFECYDEGELSVIKSLLEANGIAYFVHNEHFGSLYPGPAIAMNRRIIMVQQSDAERTRILLSRLKDPREETEKWAG
ncbi:MAG: DUF2007 domain-containing protein [Nitrospirae bacterium]|nr:MAG: DUF2007 domain-containing protein [Nitrospirota bacterium]